MERITLLSRLPATMFAVFLTGLAISRDSGSRSGSSTKWGYGSEPDLQVRELERQIKSLQQQLDEIKAAPNAAARQRLMQKTGRACKAIWGRCMIVGGWGIRGWQVILGRCPGRA